MSLLPRCLVALFGLAFLLSACGSRSTATPTIVTPTNSVATPLATKPAFETGVYPNLFKEYLGKSDEEIAAKIEAAWNQLFYGDEATERIYYPVGTDMAYISDIANEDVRSEGMSYGLMIAVQMNKKEEFDRLWKWAKTYMYQTEGGYKGYFAWHCQTDGTQLDANPASDGEVWFITALFFADGRWGSGEGIYNYRAEAQAILDVALHAEQLGGNLATNLFDPETKQVVFVPQLGQNSQFTDPSYHMPHFYELWARWADKDNEFWAAAAAISRTYLPTAVHPETGLAPNYSYFAGTPYNDPYHGNFRYDAFRVGANVGVDYVWFRPGNWHVEQSNRLLRFFTSQGLDAYKAEYLLTGEPQVSHRSPGLMATNAAAALAADRAIGEPFVQALWDQPLPTGQYRYYDGLLMMLGLLQVSGNFRIYEPGTAPAGQIFPTPRPEVVGQFAPPMGQALLLVGPDRASVDAYFEATVTAPGGIAANLSLDLTGLEELDYLAGKYPNSVLSVGVDLNDAPADMMDNQVQALLEALARYNRPVFLRLGYGEGSGNAAAIFLSAWQTFHDQIQARGTTQFALVWQPMACEPDHLADWYPGDESVDWVSTPDGECAHEIIQFAREHFKPVLMTSRPEATSSAWPEWFASFLTFVQENNDVIRAITYLNEGDRRLVNDDSIGLWKGETKQTFWLKASPQLFADLGFAK